MTLETAEIGFWLAITAWAVAFLLFLQALVFRKATAAPKAVMLAWIGLVPHAAGMAVRWIVSGRPPFISLYELVAASAWFTVVTFLVVQAIWRLARPVGVAVMPVAFISMGAAMTAAVEANPLGATLKSWWLVIHILFALLALGGFAIAFGAGILLFVRKKTEGADNGSVIPSPERLDQLAVRCIVFGFICHTVMVLSGSIWANRAWGRYWGWDPTEVWSLFTWLLYGLYLHLRFLPKWRGRRAAVYAVIAFPIMVFSFWGVPHLWDSVHDYMIYQEEARGSEAPEMPPGFGERRSCAALESEIALESSHELRSLISRLLAPNCELRTANLELRSANCELPPPTSHLRSPSRFEGGGWA